MTEFEVLNSAGMAIQDLGIAHPADEYAGSVDVFVSQIRFELLDAEGELRHPYVEVLRELQGFSLIGRDPKGLAIALAQIAATSLFVRTAVERHRKN